MYTSKCAEVLFSIDTNHIATITLNRPESNNAFTWDMFREIEAILSFCSEDDSVRAVVITGAGKHFCAGGDIKSFKQRIEDGTGLPETGMRLSAKMAAAARRCAKPVIAKINGAVSGAGVGLALACDFRVMTEKSRLIGGFVKMGFCGDTAGWYYLSKLIGTARAIEFFMLGEPMGGQEAFTLGLANRLADSESFDEVTQTVALTLAGSPTTALAYQKKMLNLVLYPDLDVVTELEIQLMVECSHTADHAEAVNAFLEKRQPMFTGQ